MFLGRGPGKAPGGGPPAVVEGKGVEGWAEGCAGPPGLTAGLLRVPAVGNATSKRFIYLIQLLRVPPGQGHHFSMRTPGLLWGRFQGCVPCQAGLLKSCGKTAGFRQEDWAPRLGALAKVAGQTEGPEGQAA